MVQIDMDALRRAAEETYTYSVFQAHGQQGTDGLRLLLEGISSIYKHLEPSLLTKPLVVVYLLDASARLIDDQEPIPIERPEAIAQHLSGAVAVQLQQDGRMQLWKDVADPRAERWANAGVVYTYVEGQESIHAKASRSVLRRVATGMASVFSLPTFTDLVEALQCYGETMSRYCRCKILAGVWEDERRLHLRPKPEATMRDSLAQFLMNRLRAEVRPEQNVDETQPVDIKVTWTFTNRVALIEIKWLGDSREGAGKPVSTTYRDARARDGALQLANYLDDNRPHAPEHITRGYLVVFDGRRRGLRDDGQSPSAADACHYRVIEIQFDPLYHELREDFAVPTRLYLEPSLGN